MEGQTEVSVNIFSMLCEVMGTGKSYESCWGGGMGPYGMSSELKKYFTGSQTYRDAPNKVQLFFWVELMYHLGFDAFRQVALQYHDKPYDLSLIHIWGRAAPTTFPNVKVCRTPARC